jgi:uncharacterized protein YjiS (DUF1127 family)
MIAPQETDQPPLLHEIWRHACHARDSAIKANLRKLAKWLRANILSNAKLGRRLAAEFRLRRNIRALQRLDDRVLSDIGLGRSEIETIVRTGRPAHATRILYRWNRTPPMQDAA